MKIGIAGVGRMGAAIAERLLILGHTVVVWNRTAAKTTPLVAAGATVAATPAALASQSELIMTILTDAGAIDATYRGNDGLLCGAVIGKLFVEMSTVRPEAERELAKSIQAKGAFLIDCPVGGISAEPVTFDIDSIRKDLRTMLEEGRALGRELPLSAKALACYDEASRKGLGPADAVMMTASFVNGITIYN